MSTRRSNPAPVSQSTCPLSIPRFSLRRQMATIAGLALALIIVIVLRYPELAQRFPRPRWIAHDGAFPSTAFSHLPRRLPDVLLIGVRKCGTRALLTFLSAHPSIRPVGRELHFFDRHFDKGVEWYLRRMPPSSVDELVVERTPAYFTDPAAPRRVLDTLGAAVKLVLIVKDPVERAVSDYLQLRNKFDERPVFDDDETLIPTFEEKVMMANGSEINFNYKPVRIGNYALHLQRWFKVFPRERVLVVNGEDFVGDPFPSLHRVETFLGLEHRISRTQFFFDRVKGFYCRREGGCLDETKGRLHPPIAPRVRAMLSEYYAPKLEEFFRMIGERFEEFWPTTQWKIRKRH